MSNKTAKKEQTNKKTKEMENDQEVMQNSETTSQVEEKAKNIEKNGEKSATKSEVSSSEITNLDLGEEMLSESKNDHSKRGDEEKADMGKQAVDIDAEEDSESEENTGQNVAEDGENKMGESVDSKKDGDQSADSSSSPKSTKKRGLSVLGFLFMVVLLSQIAMLLAGVWGYQKLKKDIQEVAGGMSIGKSQYLGDKKAKVAIVEFSDMECPFCKKYHTETFAKIRSEYIDTGKVVYVYKNYPLPFHDPIATDQALAGKCVARDLGNEKFFEFVGKIYQTTNSNKGIEREKIFDLASEVGADKDKIKQCTDTKEFANEIGEDMNAAEEFGINGTPGFYIGKVADDKVNGKVLSGALLFEVFKDRLDREIAKGK